jgi:hypothetical protein
VIEKLRVLEKQIQDLIRDLETAPPPEKTEDRYPLTKKGEQYVKSQRPH